MTTPSLARSVAVIGSFRQHNSEVQQVCIALRAAGIEVTSPQGSQIIEDGIPFVRFSSDNEDWSDPEIQSLAMHRILRAGAVYVVAPFGYIGRTTCYEVGRIIQYRRPIYFSSHPLDLPVQVPSEFIISITDLVEKIKNPAWKPLWLYENDHSNVAALERELLGGNLRNE